MIKLMQKIMFSGKQDNAYKKCYYHHFVVLSFCRLEILKGTFMQIT